MGRLAVILFVLLASLCLMLAGDNPDISRGAIYKVNVAALEKELMNPNKVSDTRRFRVLNIQDEICQDFYFLQCLQFEEKKQIMVATWLDDDLDEPEDHDYNICFQNLRVCCPRHNFGRKCNSCFGDHKTRCSGNGKCDGDTTKCVCDRGYTGLNCEICNIGFYLSYKDANKLVCSPCHFTCFACTGPTLKDCIICKTGFALDTEQGCMDINECAGGNKCKKDEFCVNSLGSYKCSKCDKACESCHGDGRDKCIKCAAQYSKSRELCVPTRILYEKQMSHQMYMRYCELLIATCMLLPKYAYLGSTFGTVILTGLILSEYYCMKYSQGNSCLVNLELFELKNLLVDIVLQCCCANMIRRHIEQAFDI